ncbi:RNA methyltransferase [Methanosarcinales archaeon]|nr:MAG: RNA methyltransferase [Methanosarcinales archaeon]
MELAFELSREHETLPKSEVFACLHALSVSYVEKVFSDGILVVDTQLSHEALDTLSRRLGITHCIYEVKGCSKPEEREILAVVKNADIDNFMEQGLTFAVRVKAKSNFISEEKKLLERDLERKAGEIIRWKGYKVNLTNPSKTFVLLITKQTCFFCLLLHAADKKQFGERKPHLRPFFSPGVIKPKIARALVNLSSIKEGGIFLDPFCGTGGILIEAGLIGATLVGIDMQAKMVRGAEKNLRIYELKANLIVGDSSKMALRDNSVDAVVTDLPYGRSSLVSRSGYFLAESRTRFLERLHRDALNEVHRVLKTRGRAVIVSNSSSLYSFSHEFHFRVLENHKYRVHKSLSRYIAILEKE